MAVADLLFYRADGSLFDRLIAAATHGPYVHVEIDLGDGTSIGALSCGVTRHPVPVPAARAPVGVALDPARRAVALGWLDQQVGTRYSWWDIAADAMQALVPAWLGSRTPLLIAPHRYDCSALTTLFLLIAGYPLPPALIASPHLVSPNDLARAVLGIPEGDPLCAAPVCAAPSPSRRS